MTKPKNKIITIALAGTFTAIALVALNTSGLIASIQESGGGLVFKAKNFQIESRSFKIEGIFTPQYNIQYGTSLPATTASTETELKEDDLIPQAEDTPSEEVHAISDGRIFADVPPDHWAYDFINELYSLGAVSGNSDGTFRPNDSINRAELAKMGVIAFQDFDTFPEPQEGKVFEDVSDNDWFAQYVYQSSMTGYLDGTFRPEKLASRAEALVALFSASGLPTENCLNYSEFIDVPDDAWFAKFVRCAERYEIIGGYETPPNGETHYVFRPEQLATRAEVVTMTINLLSTAADMTTNNDTN